MRADRGGLDCGRTTTAAAVSEGGTTARAIRVVAQASQVEGIQQTFAGLKASKKYLIGCRVTVVTGTFRLVTTGASGVTFGNLDLSAVPAGVYQTISADEFHITHCWLRECATDPIPLSNTAWAYNEITAGVVLASAVFTDSTLTVNVVPPAPGYTIEVEASLSGQHGGTQAAVFSLRESGTEVDCGYLPVELNDRATMRFSYRKLNPTAGTTYTYTVFGRGDGGGTFALNAAAIGTETPKCWIRCRAVLESGGH